jgi:hypothetical protein
LSKVVVTMQPARISVPEVRESEPSAAIMQCGLGRDREVAQRRRR